MLSQQDLQLKKDKAYAVKADAGIQVMDVDMSKKIVTGLYNTFNFFDSDYDVLLKGCAKRSINERGPQSQSVAKIKHLMFHDWCKLPGKIQTLEERKVDVNGRQVTGIYFETKMSDSTLGTDTLINYQEQVYDNHSIGFQYLDGEFIDKEAKDWQKYVDMLENPKDAQEAGFMFLWKEIRLYEGSTVAFGANELTPYLGVKNKENKEALLLKISERIKMLTKQVSSGKQSDDMLQVFEMQLQQLDQIVKEIFTGEASIKDTLLEQARLQKDNLALSFDLDSTVKSINFFN